jgi:hypothetical protein
MLDNVTAGFSIYDLPQGTKRLGISSYADIRSVVISNNGVVTAVHTSANEIALVTPAGIDRRYKLPVDMDAIRRIAISDNGDKLGLLLATSAQDVGIFQIWSLPFGPTPSASIEVPLYDYAELKSNGAFTAFALHSHATVGEKRYTSAYYLTQERLSLVPTSSELHNVVLSEKWIWEAQPTALSGWRRSEPNAPAIHLPGAASERLAFDATGKYLLAYHSVVSATNTVTRSEMLFRLFDLSTLKEIKRTSHDVENYDACNFVVTQELGLVDVRAPLTGGISIAKYSW